MSATTEQIADLCDRLKKRVLNADDLDVASSLIRAQSEREKVLVYALEEIKSDAAHVIDFYNRNGPTWTGEDGHEYDDMSSVLSRAEIIIQLADAALAGAR